MKDTLGGRISLLLTNKNLTQKDFAKLTGLNEVTVGRYINNKREPTASILKIMADALNVSVDYLLGKPIDKKENKNATRIPVYESVSAGSPLLTNDEVVDWAEIPSEKAINAEHFGLRVKGLSMYPVFQEGDLLIVRKQSDVDSGDLAIVLVNGEEATFKEVRKEKGGIMLVGYNPNVFTPRFFNVEDIHTLPVNIIGKVVEFRREL